MFHTENSQTEDVVSTINIYAIKLSPNAQVKQVTFFADGERVAEYANSE